MSRAAMNRSDKKPTGPMVAATGEHLDADPQGAYDLALSIEAHLFQFRSLEEMIREKADCCLGDRQEVEQAFNHLGALTNALSSEISKLQLTSQRAYEIWHAGRAPESDD